MTQKDENQNRVHESSSDHGEDHVFAVYRIRDVGITRVGASAQQRQVCSVAMCRRG